MVLNQTTNRSITSNVPGFTSAKHIPERWKEIDAPTPQLDMKMKASDYFSATKLLLPEKHVFKVHEPGINGEIKGLAVPRDLGMLMLIHQPRISDGNQLFL